MPRAIRLSATGVAEFVGSTPAQRRRILSPYKRKRSGEARGRAHYYRAALNAIRWYLRPPKDQGIIFDAINALELRKKGPLKRGELAQIKHNQRVLGAFLAHYGVRDLIPVPGHLLECAIGKIEITCSPDMWAEEQGRLVLVKFFFPEKKPKLMQIPILLHLIREGAHRKGLAPKVICLDMDGREHKCPVDREKMTKIVASLEKDLVATWSSV